MSSGCVGKGGEQKTARSDLGSERDRGILSDRGVQAGSTPPIEQIAEIFVDDMLRLEREHGLNAKEMFDYYRGDLELKDTD